MVLSLLACAVVDSMLEGAPARIDHAEPGTVAGREPFQLRGQVVSDKGKPLAEALTYSAVPADVAAISPSGTLTCLKSGDASIVFVGAGLTATATVRCRIVGSLRGPVRPIELLAGEPATAVAVAVLDEAGGELEDVVAELRLDDPAVAALSGASLTGTKVGITTLHAEAGGKTLELPVRVVERIKTEALSIADGATQTWTLPKGNYLVEVNVRDADSTMYGVTLKWVPAICAAEAERLQHKVECSVETTASVVIENPTGWGMGPAEVGNLTIYQVP